MSTKKPDSVLVEFQEWLDTAYMDSLERLRETFLYCDFTPLLLYMRADAKNRSEMYMMLSKTYAIRKAISAVDICHDYLRDSMDKESFSALQSAVKALEKNLHNPGKTSMTFPPSAYDELKAEGLVEEIPDDEYYKACAEINLASRSCEPTDLVISKIVFDIDFSCGYCGAPCNDDCEHVSVIPDNYSPTEFPMEGCRECWERENEPEYITVTREMALDAGDPSLEGELWRWN